MNNSNELQHFGVKGMKWGQRRYQNKDGTLTPAGVKRYNKEVVRLKKEKQVLRNQERTKAKIEKLNALRKEVDTKKQEAGMTKTPKSAKPKTSEAPKESIKSLSNEELQKRIDRINLENNYKNLVGTKQVSKGKKIADKILNEVIAPAAIDVGKQTVKSLMAEGVNKVLDLQGESKVYANNKKKN